MAAPEPRAAVDYASFQSTGNPQHLESALDHYRPARDAYAEIIDVDGVYQQDLRFGVERSAGFRRSTPTSRHSPTSSPRQHPTPRRRSYHPSRHDLITQAWSTRRRTASTAAHPSR